MVVCAYEIEAISVCMYVYKIQCIFVYYILSQEKILPLKWGGGNLLENCVIFFIRKYKVAIWISQKIFIQQPLNACYTSGRYYTKDPQIPLPSTSQLVGILS